MAQVKRNSEVRLVEGGEAMVNVLVSWLSPKMPFGS